MWLVRGVAVGAPDASRLAATRLVADDAPPPALKKLPPGARVLVTGGAGFIGFHLSSKLQKQGIHVTALDNMDPYYSVDLKRTRWGKLKQLGVETVEADLCNDTVLHALQKKRNFTHVANLAGQAGVRYSIENPAAYVRTNVQCFLSLLEMLRSFPHVPLIYASSSSVYGTNTKIPFSETDVIESPASLYAVTKHTNEGMAHTYHRLYNISVTGLRFFTVYGPWGRPDMAYFSMAERMRQGLPIELYGHGRVKRDFTYVDDIVNGIEASLALAAPEEIFNLGNHRVENVSHFVAVLEGALGVEAEKVLVGMEPGDVPLTYADCSHARQMLGYEPTTTIDTGLERFAAWFNSKDYRPEFGTLHLADTVMFSHAPRSPSDDAVGGARCEAWCEGNRQDWAGKCTWESLSCSSCAKCGTPGQVHARGEASSATQRDNAERPKDDAS
jgi:UDP-glucuronate 4-epimerase